MSEKGLGLQIKLATVMKTKAQRGFTTIELTMVMIIVAIIAATAALKFTGRGGVSVQGAAEMIQADIRYGQKAAMAEHMAKSITFAAGSTSYTVDSETQKLPAGVIITNNFTITFNSLGEPIVGGGGCVTISADGQVRTISVSNYTGKVRIE